MSAESIQLSFTQGSSDKVYHISLELKDDGYLVNFAYGRRGGPLKPGTKTAKPLPYDQAKYAYDKLVKEKMAKGYTPDGSGTPFTGSQLAPERTNYLPQLLNSIEPEDLSEALTRAQGELHLQIKYDGERRLVVVTNEEVYGANRKGLKTALPTHMVEALQMMRASVYVNRLVLDGEDMGDHIVIFDVLEWGDQDLTKDPFNIRADFLHRLDEFSRDIVRTALPRVCRSVQDIKAHAQLAQDANQEGIVLRDPRAPYTPGRPNSWGPCLKLKFYATATCFVGNIHPTKRSIALMLRQNESAIDVGNCTIPPNYTIPGLGDLVEIKYLYAYRGGSLYQPQYKGVRTDLETEDANISQLKFKE